MSFLRDVKNTSGNCSKYQTALHTTVCTSIHDNLSTFTLGPFLKKKTFLQHVHISECVNVKPCFSLTIETWTSFSKHIVQDYTQRSNHCLAIEKRIYINQWTLKRTKEEIRLQQFLVLLNLLHRIIQFIQCYSFGINLEKMPMDIDH